MSMNFTARYLPGVRNFSASSRSFILFLFCRSWQPPRLCGCQGGKPGILFFLFVSFQREVFLGRPRKAGADKKQHRGFLAHPISLEGSATMLPWPVRLGSELCLDLSIVSVHFGNAGMWYILRSLREIFLSLTNNTARDGTCVSSRTSRAPPFGGGAVRLSQGLAQICVISAPNGLVMLIAGDVQTHLTLGNFASTVSPLSFLKEVCTLPTSLKP